MMLDIRKYVADLVFPEGEIERRSLGRLVNIDHMTGTGNRRAFEMAQLSAEQNPHIRVIVFDINCLGKVNKLYGHVIGDRLIKWAAEVITSVAFNHGIESRCFRVGGDEFVVLAPGTIADLVVSDVEARFGVINFKSVKVSISGTHGQTFVAADEVLQNRKYKHKIAA